MSVSATEGGAVRYRINVDNLAALAAIKQTQAGFGALDSSALASQRALGTQFGSTVRTATAGLNAFGLAGQSAGNRITGGLGTLAGGVLAYQVVRGVSSMVKAYSDFDYQMRLMWNNQPDMAASAFRKIENDAQVFAQKMGMNATDVAKALYNVTSVGFDAGKAMKSGGILDVASKLAIGNNTDINDITPVLTSTMQAYGWTEDDKNGLGQSEATRLGNAIQVAIRDGAVEAPEMAQSLQDVLPVSAQVGIKPEDILSAYATMTKSGFSGGQTADGLRMMVNELSQPNMRAGHYFAEATGGQSFQSYIAQGHTLQDALQTLGTYAQKAGISTMQVFSRIQAKQADIALTSKKAGKDYSETMQHMAADTGAFADNYSRMQDSQKRKLAQAGASWSKFETDAGRALEPLVEDLARVSGLVADAFDNSTVSKIAAWSAGFAAMALVVNRTGAAAKGLRGYLAGLAVEQKGLAVTTAGTTGAMAAQTGTVGALAAATDAETTAQGAASVAQVQVESATLLATAAQERAYTATTAAAMADLRTVEGRGLLATAQARNVQATLAETDAVIANGRALTADIAVIRARTAALDAEIAASDAEAASAYAGSKAAVGRGALVAGGKMLGGVARTGVPMLALGTAYEVGKGFVASDDKRNYQEGAALAGNNLSATGFGAGMDRAVHNVSGVLDKWTPDAIFKSGAANLIGNHAVTNALTGGVFSGMFNQKKADSDTGYTANVNAYKAEQASLQDSDLTLMKTLESKEKSVGLTKDENTQLQGLIDKYTTLQQQGGQVDTKLADNVEAATTEAQNMDQAAKSWRSAFNMFDNSPIQVDRAKAKADARKKLTKATDDLTKAEKNLSDASKMAVAHETTNKKGNSESASTALSDQTRIQNDQAKVQQAQAAQQAAQAAMKKASGPQGLSLAKMSSNMDNQFAYRMQETHDIQKLRAAGLSASALQELYDVEQKSPGTLHRIADSINTKAFAEFKKSANAKSQTLLDDSDKFGAALTGYVDKGVADSIKSRTKSMKKAGKQDLLSYVEGFTEAAANSAMNFVGPWFSGGKGSAAKGAAKTSTSAVPDWKTEIHLHNPTFEVKDANDFAKQMLDNARKAALGRSNN